MPHSALSRLRLALAPHRRSVPRGRPAQGAAFLLAALALPALTAAPARAEFPLVGVLTGGELHSKGSGSIRADEIASDFIYDPATSDNCIGLMCNDRKDLDFHTKATLRWDTTWLVDARYPGVPTDPQASSNATRWSATVGSWSVRRQEDDYQFPDDQGDGGHENNPVSTTVNCDAPLVARMPEGAESPLLSTASSDDNPDGDFFDASRGRSFLLNAFGSTFSTGTCGPTDRYGFWGLFGLAPVEGDAITWDLGTEPREEFAWTRKGAINRTQPCDPKWTDGTPRDTETQCADHTELTAENTLECALCVTDVRYEEHAGARESWQEVGMRGTYDGNEIRISARIENRATKTLAVPLLLRDKRSGRKLEGPGLENPKTYTFPAGSTTDLQVVWKTDGFAWEGGTPASERDIQFLTPYGGAQQRIVINPRPVVLVHGWNSSAGAWDGYSGMLQAIHPLWRGYAVGDGQFTGKMDTNPVLGNDIADNATAEHLYVEDLRRTLNADHVDLVVHSMGGLISRRYIHANMPTAVDGRPAVRRLVMLGTPNMGSPCADLIRVAARGIPTQQLTTGYAKWFNTQATNRKGVPFSIAAGNWEERTCTSEVQGDGVVEVPSAHWLVGDRITTYIFHTSMTGDGHLLNSFVRPRLALDPDGAKGLAATARRQARAAQRAVASHRDRAQGGASELAAIRAAAAPTDPWATTATAKAKTVQSVGTADTSVSGTKTIEATFAPGAQAAFAFLAAPGIAAELVDPKGKVVVTQAAGSPAAQLPVRWIAAPKANAGTWKLRLKGTGSVISSAVATGGKQSLAISTKTSKKGALTVTAKLTGVSAARGAKLVAVVQGASKTKPVKRTLRRKAGGTFTMTLKKAPAGSATVVVTAKVGRAQLVSAADLG